VNGILDECPVPAIPVRVGSAAAPRIATRTSDEPARRRIPAQGDLRPQPEEPSLGELKERHRELHLCLRCTHHMVCGMAKSLDPNLLVTIATCLGFEPADADGSNPVCELLPLEPLSDLATDLAEDSSSAAARGNPP
jgi:hypothetical protein